MALAQIAPAPATTAAGDSVVELSPFVTTAGSEKGYVATSSLAGSRVNTGLKDIAAQIDVMTLEFLNDIGATNVDEAVAFSTNNGGPTEQNVGPNATITSTRSVTLLCVNMTATWTGSSNSSLRSLSLVQ